MIRQEELEVIIVGRAGTGKSTLRKIILENYPNLRIHTVQSSVERIDDELEIGGRAVAWDDNE